MGSGTASLCCAGIFFLAPVFLQGIGLFTPNWVSNSTCNIGLVVSCCPQFGTCQRVLHFNKNGTFYYIYNFDINTMLITINLAIILQETWVIGPPVSTTLIFAVFQVSDTQVCLPQQVESIKWNLSGIYIYNNTIFNHNKAMCHSRV